MMAQLVDGSLINSYGDLTLNQSIVSKVMEGGQSEEESK